MTKLDKRRLGDILQEFCAVRKDDDGDYVTILDADKNFRYDVGVFFMLSDSGKKLQIMGVCSDLKIPSDRAADALLFCNKWNKEKSYGQAYFDADRNEVRVNMGLSTENDLSDIYLKEDFLKFGLALVWAFYKEAGQVF